MNKDNKLAANINTIEKYTQLDTICKRVLSFKIILAWIMKECMEEYKDYDINDIAEKYIEGTPQIGEAEVHQDEITGMNTENSSVTEGIVTFDIIFYAVVPKSVNNEMVKIIINIEAQSKFNPGYSLIKRAVYYCSRMISSQYGREFTESNYDKIKKVYSVWICTNSPKKRHNTITKYSIKEENIIGRVIEKVSNYDLMTVIFICLGNENEENYDGILKLLKTLLSSKISAEKKKHILQNEFKIKLTYEMGEEVNSMCNISYGIAEESIKEGMKKGIKEGMKEGMKEGIKEGIKEGMKEGISNSIKNLMESMNWDIFQAMDALKIPEKEKEKYLNLLKE